MKNQAHNRRRRRVLDTKADRSARGGQGPRPEQAVPDTEDCTKIAYPITVEIVNACVMPLVKERRNQKMLDGAERPAHICVNQQRRGADEYIGRNYGGDGKPHQQKDDAHHSGVQRLADGVKARSREPIKLLAGVMHQMKCPQHRKAMVCAVYPIREKIRNDNSHPDVCQRWERGHARAQQQEDVRQSFLGQFHHQCVRGCNRKHDAGSHRDRMNQPDAKVREKSPPPPLVRGRRWPAAFEKREQRHQHDELNRRCYHWSKRVKKA